jgi:5-(carboxyamino)imidazole ribonucleotide synthase
MKPIFPSPGGAVLGVVGGGQLGRMFVQAAQAMGYSTAVLEPETDSPAGQISQHVIAADYADPEGLAHLSGLCSAITTEFENVPAEALRSLAATRAVAPNAACVAVAQNRIEEKRRLSEFAALSGVHCAPYAVIESADDLAKIPQDLLPGILKTARLGYDGKGQIRVPDAARLASAWAELGSVPCVLEQQVALLAECSVIVCRGWDGQMVNFPVQRNVHVDGILAVTHVYASNLPAAQSILAVAATKSIAKQLGYVGVLCVEFFLTPAGGLLVNEIAPRPHNSGHYTVNACDVSQFELQVRALAGLPLVQPRQHSPAIMLNLLGDLWLDADGNSRTPDWDKALCLPGAHLHLYGKAEARAGRKMGHLTVTGDDVGEVKAIAGQAAAILGLRGMEG